MNKQLLFRAFYWMGAASAAMFYPLAAHSACTDTATAATATAGSSCTASNASYTATNQALFATGSNSRLAIPGTVSFRQAGGNNSHGLYALNGGTVVASDDVIVEMQTSSGTNRRGISTGANSLVDIQGNITITGMGGSSHRGISSEYGGLIIYRGTTDIDFTASASSVGLRANDGTTSTVEAIGETRITMSDNGRGMYVSGGGNLLFRAPLTVVNAGTAIHVRYGNIEVAANSSINSLNNAVLFGDNTAPKTFTAGSGLSINSDAIGFNYDANVDITLSLDTATVNAPQLWNVDDMANASYTAVGGTYTGASTVNGSGILNVNMTNSAIWNLNADAQVSTLSLTGRGTLSAPGGTYTVTGNVDNQSGVIDLQGLTVGAAGDELTISGNYSGGGELVLDTVLGDSSSLTDHLIVDGDVLTGVTRISVNNIAGAGAETSGDGILVVSVSGASPAALFALAQPVQAGDYAYTLHQVGQNWYLQSTFSPNNNNNNSTAAAIPLMPPLLLGLLSALMLVFASSHRQNI